MEKNKAKIFICTHPDSLLIYKNFSKMVRARDKDAEIILFKVNHAYFLKFDFAPYEKYFDRVIVFPYIHYKKNFFAGIWQGLAFQKKLKKIINQSLVNFKTIDLFFSDSTWLPTNALLFNLSKLKNVKNIIIYSLWDPKHADTKTDRLKTLFCDFYSLFLDCYRIKVLKATDGKYAGLAYAEKLPGTSVKLVSPLRAQGIFDYEKENILPYPIVADPSETAAEKDMVIVFGEANIFEYYSQYFSDHDAIIKKLEDFFDRIQKKYSDCRLYYKPHPTNKGKIMAGVDIGKYNLFDNTTNAEMLFDKYHAKIRAVYSFSSAAVISGSFFGIPSYTFYRYLCNPEGTKKFNIFFNEDNIKSQFLFHLADLGEIGKIDGLERSKNYIDPENISLAYKKALNLS